METKDPALTKTPISSHETTAEMQAETTPHVRTDDADHMNSVDEHNEHKGTQTLQETVVGSGFVKDMENLDDPVDASMANKSTDERIAGEDVTHEEPLRKAVVDEELAEREVLDRSRATDNPNHRDRQAHENTEENTRVNKGTETLKEDEIDSEHVKDGDNPARQPDRRDQEGGSPFDENINEETVGSEEQQSNEITDRNRYSTVNNAQTRTLTPDEED